jgi:dihydrofolate reductase
MHVTLFIATSLDGYIADTRGSVDWLFHDADYGYEAFFETVDAIVMGRRTLGQVLGSGPWPYEEKPTMVFGRGRPTDAPSHVELTTDSPTAVLERLEQRGVEHVWLVGGAGLVASFRREDRIDRYVLSVHPILLGGGLRLFGRDLPPAHLHLMSAKPLEAGLVQLTYERA